MNPCLTGTPPGATIYSADFEGGANGWTHAPKQGYPDLWHTTTFAGNGSASDALFHGGPGRWYYGIENAHGGSYNTHNRNQGDLRSPEIAVPAGSVAVALKTKWHVEWDRAMVIDSMQVGYVNAAGQRTTLCSLGNQYAGTSNIVMGYGYYQNSPSGQAILTACEYSLESPQNPCRVTQDFARLNTNFDLAPVTTMWEPRWVLLPSSLAGQTVKLSFFFTTGDAIVDDAMGWMVDDVQVVRIS